VKGEVEVEVEVEVENLATAPGGLNVRDSTDTNVI